MGRMSTPAFFASSITIAPPITKVSLLARPIVFPAWMAAKVGDIVVSQCMHLPGERSQVIDRATNQVLIMLLKLLREME